LCKMGELIRFIDEMRADPRIGLVRFSRGFLEDVGNVLYRRGFDETRLFIWDHIDREDLRGQALPLLLVLDKMEGLKRVRDDRSIGRYIIKNKLDVLFRGRR
jgi:hypothetical protein